MYKVLAPWLSVGLNDYVAKTLGFAMTVTLEQNTVAVPKLSLNMKLPYFMISHVCEKG